MLWYSPLPQSCCFRRFLCGYWYLLLGGSLHIVWRPGPVHTGGFERLSSAVGRLNAWGGWDVMVLSWPKPCWWKGASRRPRYSNWVERLCFRHTRSSWDVLGCTKPQDEWTVSSCLVYRMMGRVGRWWSWRGGLATPIIATWPRTWSEVIEWRLAALVNVIEWSNSRRWRGWRQWLMWNSATTIVVGLL